MYRCINSINSCANEEAQKTDKLYYHIFKTFEQCWQDQLGKNGRIQEMLQKTWFPQVARTKALEQDLMFLYQDKAKFSDPKLALQVDFVDHIRKVSNEKPHVLLAYGHVLYLALFAGGRMTRTKILSQKGLFAKLADKSSSDEEKIAMKVTNFLHFDVEDEMSLRAEYKTTYELATRNDLSEEEKQDIIEESNEIFRRLIECLKEIESNNLQSQKMRIKKDRVYNAAIYILLVIFCLAYFATRIA